MSTPFLIPLDATPQSLSIGLGGVLYTLIVKWCWPAQCWIIDILDSNGTPLLSGIAIVTGADLLDQFEYLGFGGQFIVQTNNDTDAVPTFDNLGSQGNLYFVVPS